MLLTLKKGIQCVINYDRPRKLLTLHSPGFPISLPCWRCTPWVNKAPGPSMSTLGINAIGLGSSANMYCGPWESFAFFVNAHPDFVEFLQVGVLPILALGIWDGHQAGGRGLHHHHCWWNGHRRRLDVFEHPWKSSLNASSSEVQSSMGNSQKKNLNIRTRDLGI